MLQILTVKLPRRLAARLSAKARKQQSTRSAVVREALERHLGEGDGGGASFLDLAQDLAGCLDGPTDLASSKRHLAGYGR